MGDIKELETIEKNKKIYVRNFIYLIKKITFALICVLFILFFSFIYPMVSNFLISQKIIENIEQLEKYIGIFKGFNVLTIIIIVLLIIHENDISIPELMQKLFSNFDLSLKNKDTELSLTHNTQKQVQYEAIKMAQDTKKVVQDGILLEKTEKDINIKCNECKKEEIISENESLRYFSAYRITNKYSQELLIEIRNHKKIKITDFESNMREYYNRTIKNMGRKRKEDFINKKIEDLLRDLRFINIIEYSEDDLFLVLTANGEEFVNGLNKEEVG